MNRVVLFSHQIEQNQVEINDPKVIDHLINHLKIKNAQKIKATIVESGFCDIELIKNENNQKLIFNICNEIKPTKKNEIHLLIGASRPPTMKKIFEHASTMGVTHFHIFKAKLSEKSYLTSKIYEERNIEKLFTLGLEQSANSYIWPQIFRYDDLRPDSLQLPKHNRFLLSLNAHNFLYKNQIKNNEDRNKKDPIILAIGPERGFHPDEEKLLQCNHFSPIKVSAHTLRVESACYSILAQIELLSSI